MTERQNPGKETAWFPDYRRRGALPAGRRRARSRRVRAAADCDGPLESPRAHVSGVRAATPPSTDYPVGEKESKQGLRETVGSSRPPGLQARTATAGECGLRPFPPGDTSESLQEQRDLAGDQN